MTRVVADTNIFISALIFGGLPGTVLELAFMGAFQLVTSPVLLDELDEKLGIKFELSNRDAALIRYKLEAAAIVVRPTVALQIVSEDPDDDRVLECALAGNAKYIVSGDRHLLKLVSYQNVEILTARQFLDRQGSAS